MKIVTQNCDSWAHRSAIFSLWMKAITDTTTCHLHLLTSRNGSTFYLSTCQALYHMELSKYSYPYLLSLLLSLSSLLCQKLECFPQVLLSLKSLNASILQSANALLSNVSSYWLSPYPEWCMWYVIEWFIMISPVAEQFILTRNSW